MYQKNLRMIEGAILWINFKVKKQKKTKKKTKKHSKLKTSTIAILIILPKKAPYQETNY